MTAPVPPETPRLEPRPTSRARRALALLSLTAAIAATITVLATASGTTTTSPRVLDEVRSAETQLDRALGARAGAPDTGAAILAARRALTALDAIALGPLDTDTRAAIRARRLLIEALGSSLRNPRSPLAAKLPSRRAAADSAGRRIDAPVSGLRWTPSTPGR